MKMISETVNFMETEIKNVLGSDWHKLIYKYDVSKNDFLDATEYYYGVAVAGGNYTQTTMMNFSYQNAFDIILCGTFVNLDNEDSQQQMVLDLFDEIQNIYKKLINSKGMMNQAGIPVLNITNFTIDNPTVSDSLVTMVGHMDFIYRIDLKL